MKNNRVLNFLLTVLQLFMQMCVAVAAVNLVLHGFMGYEKFQVWNTFYIGIVVFIYYVAKSCIGSGKISFVIHFLAAASVWFAVNGSAEDKILVFVPALLLGFYSLKRTSQKPFVPLDMTILVVCYLAGFSVKSESATVIPFYCAVMYLIAFFIWYNISNLNRFVSENNKVKSFNTEQAVNVNSVMLVIFMLVCVAVMLIVPRLHLQSAITAVLLGIWKVLLAGFHALNIEMPTGGYEQEMAMESTPDYTGEEMAEFFGEAEGSRVLNIIAAVFAAVIFICMIILLIKALKDIRYKKSIGNDVKEFVRPEFKKKEKTEPGKKKFYLFNEPNELAVRKIYKHVIQSGLKKNQSVKQTHTPREISSEIIGWTEETEDMTMLYEKARYSGETITREEVERIQKSRKLLK